MRYPDQGANLQTIREDGLRGFIYTMPSGEKVLMQLTDIRGCYGDDSRRAQDPVALLDGLCQMRMAIAQERQVRDAPR